MVYIHSVMANYSAFLKVVLVLQLLFVSVYTLGGYKLKSITENHGDIVAHLEIRTPSNTYGPDIQNLKLTVRYESTDSVRVHITDLRLPRWEVPDTLIPRPRRPDNSSLRTLQFVYTEDPFTFSIVRTSTGDAVFSSGKGLTFKDQYLEISTTVPRYARLYGLGESTRKGGFTLLRNATYSLWTSDTSAQTTDVNLYGSWPFYIDVRKGYSHGVLLLNSNGMDIEYGPDTLTYKVLGGVFDFYFFAGPTPLSVVEQLTDLIGKPAPMPYWSLGFHQCKYGFKNVEELQSVVTNYTLARIPLEVMWTDIDYMDSYKDFTLDPVNFPKDKLQSFVERLHSNQQKYVIIIDPGIKVEDNYTAYERGKEVDIFIKDMYGTPYMGQVWPGPVHFPDFLNPKTSSYWTREISDFHGIIPFDGLWIDMNEASNFCSGTVCVVGNQTDCFTDCCLVCSVNASSQWENPPFVINNNGVKRPIGWRTVSPSATHYGGVLEYDAHNLYGLAEATVTNTALKETTGKRPFLLSRSTFIGSGRYTAHWSGDNGATWEDLRYSIVSILNSGMVGIPMVGADICGFIGNTTEELCNRWIQLGAFYPFSRNHNDIQALPHQLYMWASVAESARNVLSIRYRLLPYLYTLVYSAHSRGWPIARPLFFVFPEDSRTLGIDSQFMLGNSVMVSPVLYKGASSVEAYFPEGTWYDFSNHSRVITSHGSTRTLPALLSSTNVHVRGGSIVPMQQEAMTTSEVRRSPFTLLVAFPEKGNGSGSLFLDNGEDVEMELTRGRSTVVEFAAEKSRDRVFIGSRVRYGEFAMEEKYIVNTVVIVGSGLTGNVSELFVNSIWKGLVPGNHGIHELSGLNLPLGKPFQIYLKTV